MMMATGRGIYRTSGPFLLVNTFPHVTLLFDAIFYEGCTVWACITRKPCKCIDIGHPDFFLIVCRGIKMLVPCRHLKWAGASA